MADPPAPVRACLANAARPALCIAWRLTTSSQATSRPRGTSRAPSNTEMRSARLWQTASSRQHKQAIGTLETRRVVVDPEFVDVLAVFAPLQFADPAAQRAAFAAMPAQEPPPWPRGVRRADATVAAADGHEVPLRRYIPDAPTREGTVVWIHGGGYCVGSPDEDEAFCAYLARDVGAVVASVDYRLAPEHPFPAGNGCSGASR